VEATRRLDGDIAWTRSGGSGALRCSAKRENDRGSMATGAGRAADEATTPAAAAAEGAAAAATTAVTQL